MEKGGIITTLIEFLSSGERQKIVIIHARSHDKCLGEK